MTIIEIAGVRVGIKNRYKHIERLCRDYIVEGEPEFVVSADEADIEKERASSCEDFSPGYLESTALYRKIAEVLWRYDAFVLHGAVIAVDGAAYAFLARSGVGKTTHTRLWLDMLGERAGYVNGDKPVIRIIDGKPYAYGTPWRGKEGYGENIAVPLSGIALLRRGEVNTAAPVAVGDAVTPFLSQIYLPKAAGGAVRVLALADTVLSSVKLIEVYCNIEPDAPIPPAREFGIKI